MSGMRFPVRLVLFLLLATLGGLLAFDIYENDGFGKSRTSRFLDDTGVLVFIDQVSQRVQIYSTKAWEWTRENVPLYYAKTVEKVGPVIEQGWEKTQEGAAWVVNKTEPHREWVKQKVPEAIAWVQEKAPTLYEQAYIYGDQAWHFTKDTSIWAWENAQTHSIWLWEQTKEASASSVVWLKENVFVGNLSPENLQKTFHASIAAVQTYSLQFVQWCQQMYSPANSTLPQPEVAAEAAPTPNSEL